jgi:hypothetical protein
MVLSLLHVMAKLPYLKAGPLGSANFKYSETLLRHISGTLFKDWSAKVPEKKRRNVGSFI